MLKKLRGIVRADCDVSLKQAPRGVFLAASGIAWKIRGRIPQPFLTDVETSLLLTRKMYRTSLEYSAIANKSMYVLGFSV